MRKSSDGDDNRMKRRRGSKRQRRWRGLRHFLNGPFCLAVEGAPTACLPRANHPRESDGAGSTREVTGV